MSVLSLGELRTLPEAKEFDSGVYFLWKEGKLQYIGKSRNLLDRRWRQDNVNRYIKYHRSRTALAIPSDQWSCLVVESGPVASPDLDHKLREIEALYIEAYNPPFNSSNKNGLD